MHCCPSRALLIKNHPCRPPPVRSDFQHVPLPSNSASRKNLPEESLWKRQEEEYAETIILALTDALKEKRPEGLRQFLGYNEVSCDEFLVPL